MKILGVSPFGIYPPISGFSTRVHSLNLEVSKSHSFYLFSQGIRRFEKKFTLHPWISDINQNYKEYRYANMGYIGLIYLLDKLRLPPIYAGDALKFLRPEVLNEWIKGSDLIQVELPWQFEYIFKRRPKNVPLTLVEHDIEFKLWEQINRLPPHISAYFIKVAKEKERYAVEHADAVFAMSEQEKRQLVDIFKIPGAKVHVIPNGVDVARFRPAGLALKEEAKEKLGLCNKKVIIFTGAASHQNVEAVNKILEISRKIGDSNVIFIVAGAIGQKFQGSHDNVHFTGFVPDISPYFTAADIAINPMVTGGGTNVKMLEYLAAGLPIITTEVGARGIDVTPGKDAIITGVGNFPQWIEGMTGEMCLELSENGRKLAEEKYDWKKIARKQVEIYADLVASRKN